MKFKSPVWIWKWKMLQLTFWQTRRPTTSIFVCCNRNHRSPTGMSKAMQQRRVEDRNRLNTTSERVELKFERVFLIKIVYSPMSFVSPKFAAFGKLRKIKKNAMMWIMKPRMTMGSRPSLLDVRVPRRPNAMPPKTSPTPMKMPDKPTSCFADSPILVVNPMLGE